MVNYQDGKIYRLVSESGKQYIGSTTQKLCKRLASHRVKYKKWKDGKTTFVTSFSLFEEENGNVDIVLVEKFSCETKEELHQRERYWIETIECVNKQIPTRTKKEWYEQNKERILEQNKQYYEQNRDQTLERIKNHYEKNKEKVLEYHKHHYEENKEQILEQKKQKIQCECGAKISRSCLSRHKKSKKHLDLVASTTR